MRSDSSANLPQREWGRFGVLLVALLVQLAVLPFLPGDPAGGIFFRLSWTLVVLAGLLIASRNRTVLWVALALGIPSLILRWTGGSNDQAAAQLALTLSGAVFLIFTAGVVLKTIYLERRVKLDEIFGGVLVYILLGVIFGQVHYALEIANPGAYLLGDVALSSIPSNADGNLIFSFLYYSFTTLTTLGYGDIRPALHASRMLSTGEALTGQLYLAIFIARLVGSYLSQKDDS